jgi:hypothetical protein
MITEAAGGIGKHFCKRFPRHLQGLWGLLKISPFLLRFLHLRYHKIENTLYASHFQRKFILIL